MSQTRRQISNVQQNDKLQFKFKVNLIFENVLCSMAIPYLIFHLFLWILFPLIFLNLLDLMYRAISFIHCLSTSQIF